MLTPHASPSHSPLVSSTMHGASRVYIVLVNWNGARDTIECLESLLRLDDDNFRIVVCDNGSQDNSISQITEWAAGRNAADVSGPPWSFLPPERRSIPSLSIVSREARLAGDGLITIVDIRENLGFAGANNVGIRLAQQDKSTSHVWLLNSDTVVDPFALTNLRERASAAPSIGIVGSTLVDYNDAVTLQGAGKYFNYFTGISNTLGRGASKFKLPDQAYVESRITYTMGASMFVSQKFLLDIGLMSEEYFLYFEELDWSARAEGKFLQAWSPMSIVFHKEGGSIGTRTNERPSDLSIYFLSISFLRFIRKYYLYILPITLLRLAALATRHIIRKDPAGAWITFMAIRDFFTGTPPLSSDIWKRVQRPWN